MRKIFIALIIFIYLLGNFFFVCHAEENTKIFALKLQSDDVKFIDFNIKTGQGSPHTVDEKYLRQNFNYSTWSINDIAYIVHYLNSINLIDDGETLSSADGSYVRISLKKTDDSVCGLTFSGGQRFSDGKKQYAVDQNEYRRFIAFMYALKTEKIVLNDDVSYDSSNWANLDIKKAIEKGLVPKWNQIGYTNNITRLEVCQLIDNYLHVNKIQSYTDNYANPQFTDTEDTSVTCLWNKGIINGKSETLFCPYDLINREEFAKILSYTYHHVKRDVMLEGNKTQYKDRDRISNWAIASVADMTSLGLLMGNEKGEFEPLKNITKEEIIVTILRLENVN